MLNGISRQTVPQRASFKEWIESTPGEQAFNTHPSSDAAPCKISKCGRAILIKNGRDEEISTRLIPFETVLQQLRDADREDKNITVSLGKPLLFKINGSGRCSQIYSEDKQLP
jgi:hypothetical protein